MDFLVTTLAPLATDVVSVAILALFALLQVSIRRTLGLQAEKIWREALHSAVETGAGTIDADDVETAAAQVVAYARRSVPEAIASLKAGDDVLFDLARAKLRQLIARGT